MNKETILSEIVRIANQNDGVPPGKSAFFNETGIKESDWAGKYWSKWGDAVRDAGYQPNEMNPAYSDARLISALANIVEDMGKWPTANELKIYLRDRADLPTKNVYDRLGNRRRQAELVIDYLMKNNRRDIVNSINISGLPDSEPDPEREQADECRDEKGRGLISGSIYLFKSDDVYKIGLTNNLGRRQGEFKTLTAKPMLLIHEVKSDDIYGIERYWHKRFDSVRCNGEWFKLTSEHIKAFRKRKFM